MALDTAPLLAKKKRLAFDTQASTGTPATLAAAQAVTPTYNTSLKFATETIDREQAGSLSRPTSDLGAASATCEFETKMPGSGTPATAPYWGRLLEMCGMQLSAGVYTPLSNAVKVGTFGRYVNGRLKRMSDAMGTFTITFKRGSPPVIKWTFTGIRQPPGDVALPAATEVTVEAARCGDSTFTIGGTHYVVDEVTFDAGNIVILREDVDGKDEASNPTGYRAAYITDRKPMFKVAPEALLFATKNWYADRLSKATAAISINVGHTAGNQFTLAAPKCQLDADPDDGDRNGMLTDQLEFLCTRNSDAGDDEYSITVV